MTRAVDQWIWPASMPNYVLSARVKLPPQFSVCDASGHAREVVNLAVDTDAAWHDVWRRRAAYFASVLLTFALIDDKMSALWRATLAPAPAAVAHAPTLRRDDALIARLRKARLYQKSLQLLKWRIAPAAFAALILFSAGAAVVVLISTAF